jgi:hypothetical protein
LPRPSAAGRANASRLADAGAAADQPTNVRASRASHANVSVTDASAAANQSANAGAANTGAPDAGTPNRCPAHAHTRAVTDC